MSDGSWERYLQHTEAMNILAEEREFIAFKMLRPKIGKDGNRWCVLLGEDLQTGVSGWGDTPNNAILAFGQALHDPSGSREIVSARAATKGEAAP